jgi:hypothetical protein
MLQHSPLVSDPRPVAPARHEHAATPGELVSLVRELRSLGLEPRLAHSSHGVMSGGAALRLSARDFLASPELAAYSFTRLRRLLMQGLPVTLAINDTGNDQVALRVLEHLFVRLKSVLSAPCIRARPLDLAVAAKDLPLPEYLAISRVLLGGGRRYAILDDALMRHGSTESKQRADATWSYLFLQRARVMPVYGGGIRTRCPLLGDEATGSVLPQLALLVPPDTAWLPVDLNLCDFTDRHGLLRHDCLRATLRRGLLIADALFDKLYWPDAMQREDAYLNRRIAVNVTGIGDYVKLCRANPAGIACLRELDRLFGRMHGWLWDQSRAIARDRGLLPALARKDPSLQWSDENHRRAWQQRWQDALQTAAVRHRNLLVLSPYSVLPRSGAAAQAFADLLPLLAHADACSFAAPPSFDGWSIKEFKHFHRRAFAVMQLRNAATFVAPGT